MRIPMAGASRLARLTCSCALVLVLSATPGRAAAPIEKALPDSTFLFVKAANMAGLREAFRQSQTGQLLEDPALKPLKDDVLERLAEANKTLQEKVGVTIEELINLPQGAVTVAAVAKSEGAVPLAVLITADAGKNDSKMAEVMTKATKQAEEAGGKVATEDFKGLSLRIIQMPQEDEDKPAPPLVWTSADGIYHIATDVDALKDFITHADGRDDSLESNESYTTVLKKIGSEGQVHWFFDIAKTLDLALKAGAAAGGGNAQQAEAILQITGLKGLKAAGGSYAMNVGPYDSLNKTFVLAPAPAQGVLKLFQMPKANLRPQPWVPATVATYQSISWDLDGAYTALNDLANMFNPGIIGVLEQQLVGPEGGEPLSFQKDIFGPLGDRISIVSDFKKPVTEDSARLLFAVDLEDAKAFQTTLNKLISLAGGAPKKREFQGTTIYDFQLPEVPNTGPNNPFKGQISLAIAKDTLFLSFEPTLLEQILRGGASSLADSPAFQAVVKDVPAQTSTLSYARPEEQARQSYEMLKSGQFEKAFEGAAAAGGPDLSKVFGDLIDKDKVPDFEVFAKYLSPGGGYGVMEDDGAVFTQFTLRKANP